MDALAWLHNSLVYKIPLQVKKTMHSAARKYAATNMLKREHTGSQPVFFVLADILVRYVYYMKLSLWD